MQIEGWLSGGDLRSDGDSDQVVEFVLANPFALGDLMAALHSKDDVVRGRAADALEKVGRSIPEQVDGYFVEISARATSDDVPMVRWHLAMLLGHLLVIESRRPAIGETLRSMLDDDSVFVLSWVITSLALLALLEPEFQSEIVSAIAAYQNSDSAALRTRAAKALAGLTDPEGTLPDGWIKSSLIQKIL